MARLPGDPGAARWLWFAVGFRLPAEYRDWVKHELTDAGWRLRTVLRHLAIIVPICALLVVLLAPLGASERLIQGGSGSRSEVGNVTGAAD